MSEPLPDFYSGRGMSEGRRYFLWWWDIAEREITGNLSPLEELLETMRAQIAWAAISNSPSQRTRENYLEIVCAGVLRDRFSDIEIGGAA